MKKGTTITYTLRKVAENNAYSFIGKIADMRTWFLNPHEPPEEAWQVFYGSSWAVAGRAAKRAAMNEVVWDDDSEAARLAAASAATHAGREKEWHAVFNSATEAVRAAAGKKSLTTRRARMDAAVLASLLLVEDLEFEGKEQYLKRARERWSVWQKGYALLCDKDGKLYVYARQPLDMIRR